MRSPDVLELEAPDVDAAGEGRPTFSSVRLAALLGVLALVGVWNIRVLLVILTLAFIIFLHELGHFLTARHADMKVTEFFLGIGPRIWSFRRGEVEYGIKAIPAVAYVRILGMSNIDEVPPEDEARAYRQKPYRQRMAVALAGSGMHFLLALVLAFGLFVFAGQRDLDHWVVDSTTPESAAAIAGLRHGDQIVAIDGHAVATHAALSREIVRRPGQTVDLSVIRNGHHMTVPATLGSRSLIYGTVGEDVSLAADGGTVSVNSIDPKGVQYAAGLRDGDVVRSINGVALTSLSDLPAAAHAAKGGDLAFVIERGGTTSHMTVDLGTKVAAQKPGGFLGVGQDLPRQRMSVLNAAKESVLTFGRVAGGSVTGVAKVFNPANLASLSSKVLSGQGTSTNPTEPTSAQNTTKAQIAADSARPVSIIGIVGLGSQSASFADFIELLVMVNIVIGIINLIPLLPFDGGHAAIATYEKFREVARHDGKRYFADVNKLMPIAFGVIMLMVTVGVLGAFLDITNPIKF
jgi:RIP metalloprotease RseP